MNFIVTTFKLLKKETQTLQNSMIFHIHGLIEITMEKEIKGCLQIQHIPNQTPYPSSQRNYPEIHMKSIKTQDSHNNPEQKDKCCRDYYFIS